MSRLNRFKTKPVIVECKLEMTDGEIKKYKEGKFEGEVFEDKGKDGKSKEVKYYLIERITVKPLKTPNMDTMLDLAVAEKKLDTMHTLVKKVLKENIPDFTEEEYNDMDFCFMQDILDAILEVNGMGDEVDDFKQKFLEDMKAKQQEK